ncbi:sugar ABC transporter substrate-binding protein, partial [Schumannella sp. 10F1B-5-1]
MISIAALAGASALVLAGCSSTSGDGGNGGGTASTRACVILPDTESSDRWENGDRPALEKAFTDAGFEADIQNAQGSTDKMATIADQQFSKGCGVMLVVDYQGAGSAVVDKAKAEGVPV